MFENIRKDIQRHVKTTPKGLISSLESFINFYGLHALVVYRFGRWLLAKRSYPLCWPVLPLLVPVYWIMSAYVRLAYDIHLDPSAEIGAGLYIGHFGGIRVVKCRLGSHCAIQQEVRLQPEEGSLLGPQIGKRVWIGAHTLIQGNIMIGDGATIGAGACVKEDVLPNSLVLGNPARVIQRDYDNSNFL